MSRQPLRVVVATTEYAPFRGGLATYSEVLARGLRSKGIDVEVLAPKYPEQPVDTGVRVTRVGVYELKSWYGRRAALAKALYRATAGGDQPIVLATTYLYAQVAAILGLLFPLRFRLVVTVCGPELIGFGRWSPRDWWRKWILWMLGRRAHGIICISKYSLGLATAAGLPPSKCPVVYVGVDDRAFRRVDGAEWRRKILGGAEGRILLTVGRLERRKGHDTALRAVAQLRESFPEIRYVIVGVGPEENRLRTLAASLGIEQHVVWHGRAAPDELCEAYSGSDVFLFPTRQEGRSIEAQGLVIIEAGLCEGAVVVGAHGGAVEIVTHEKTGLLFDPSDPSAAAGAVKRLLQDPAWSRDLGRSAAAEWRVRFSIENMVDQTIKVFAGD